MKRVEMQKKSDEKVQAIKTLCKQLEVELSAEQMINEHGMIKNVVFFLDTEIYEEDKPEEIKETKTNDEEIAPVRE